MTDDRRNELWEAYTGTKLVYGKNTSVRDDALGKAITNIYGYDEPYIVVPCNSEGAK